METIYLPQLAQAPDATEELAFKEYFSDLETLTPVQGHLKVIHQGNYIEVSVAAETIVTLTCHRCLQQYNHRIQVETSEFLWLDAAAEAEENLPLEKETPLEELVEQLSPWGYFDPAQWIYEQLCLAMPSRQLCDSECEGIALEESEEELIDSRWAPLAALKEQLSG
ncbi:YceD family protein [Geitlerinema sp. PCC 9228]|uniref:YceD family protein n=1 Tax=Geitlerinema sp. PCC 9228 TaxID=111611 RepID=UPI0008F9CE0B|nr:YceD family protein [Geitlerinema sp. PCC 9228]